jgi:hypothetical protein
MEMPEGELVPGQPNTMEVPKGEPAHEAAKHEGNARNRRIWRMY